MIETKTFALNAETAVAIHDFAKPYGRRLRLGKTLFKLFSGHSCYIPETATSGRFSLGTTDLWEVEFIEDYAASYGEVFGKDSEVVLKISLD